MMMMMILRSGKSPSSRAPNVHDPVSPSSRAPTWRIPYPQAAEHPTCTIPYPHAAEHQRGGSRIPKQQSTQRARSRIPKQQSTQRARSRIPKQQSTHVEDPISPSSRAPTWRIPYPQAAEHPPARSRIKSRNWRYSKRPTSGEQDRMATLCVHFLASYCLQVPL
jgi:hypothetical protein